MNEPSEAALKVYRTVLMDSELRELREQYCRVVSSALRAIAGWLTLDALLGGGDVTGFASEGPPGPDRYVAFRGAAAVVTMASELSSAAVGLLDQHLVYAATATIRQLLETEYLLAAFAKDFSRAAEWARATPEDIRRSFQPSRMRNLGNFNNREYWNHCSMGGHPNPLGMCLLRPLGAPDALTVASTIWADLAQHLRRLWVSANGVLLRHHARYQSVRAAEIDRVRQIEDVWVGADPLAELIDFTLLNDLAEEVGDGLGDTI